jgi:hypothetical protein
MSASGANPLVPTFTGFVQNSMDGLILFEACLRNTLRCLPRRPHDRERSQLIKSGNIFIYEENTSGIKRWTDGVAWSPSRVLGNFLIYRELDKPFPPGEKKRAIKRTRNSLPDVDSFQRGNSGSWESVQMPRPPTPPEALVNEEVNSGLSSSEQDKELERSLIGSSIDSYGFRADGLIKKTMSISFNEIALHMVSYCTADDVKHEKLTRPLQDPRLQDIFIRSELYRNQNQNFRAPIEYYAINQQGFADPRVTYRMAVDGKNMSLGQYYSTNQHPETYAYPQMIYSMAASGQNMRPAQYYPSGQYPGMYAPMATSNAGHAAMYSTMPGTQWAQQPATTYADNSSYTAVPSYGGYYRPGSQSEANPAEPHVGSQLLDYNNHYSALYRGECHGSSGTMLLSPFQSPA